MTSSSHPDCSFTLFHSAELAYLDLFTVFNSVNFSFEWNFIWNFWGLGKKQGSTLSRQRNWLFFPLSCYILGEKPRLCLQEAEMSPRPAHSPWKSFLSQIGMKTRSSLASSRRVDSLTSEYVFSLPRPTPAEEVSSPATAFQEYLLSCFLEDLLFCSGLRTLFLPIVPSLCSEPLQLWPCWVPTVEGQWLHL